MPRTLTTIHPCGACRVHLRYGLFVFCTTGAQGAMYTIIQNVTRSKECDAVLGTSLLVNWLVAVRALACATVAPFLISSLTPTAPARRARPRTTPSRTNTHAFAGYPRGLDRRVIDEDRQ